MFSTGNQTVDSIGMINFAGNVIPASWYRAITKENGKAHLLAIVILADIVYWYRPVEVRDEDTGQMIGYRKKFASDLLQRSYDAIAEQVGEDKRAVKRAIDVLEKLGVIRIEFRTVTYSNGKKANNVMFIDLNADKLFEITYNNPITKIGNSLLPKMVTASYQNWQQPITKIGNTNTENTIHRLHTDISSSSCTDKDIQGEDEEEEIKKQINYKELGKEFGHVVDKLVSSILELEPSIRQKVTPDIAKDVCRTYKNRKTVVAPVKYMASCIRNLIDGGIPPDKVTPFVKQNSFTSGSLIRSDYDFDELEKNILSN